jgi:hypothetical protein
MRIDMMNDAAEMLKHLELKCKDFDNECYPVWLFMKWERPEWVMILKILF